MVQYLYRRTRKEGHCMDQFSYLNDAFGKFEESYFAEVESKDTYVRITPDDMQAWLYLREKENKMPYSKEELLILLKQNDVISGINESNVSAMAKKSVYDREIKVADALLPREGVNGYYEYMFDTTGSKHAPKIREDGSVDYQSMNALQNIKKGAVIARYHKAIPGETGRNVRGIELPVAQVKDLPVIRGMGFAPNPEDENEYLALQDGKIDFRDGKISINKVHEVRGDVDLADGNVEFFGDILISGNVGSGVTIRAGKTLTIEGTVEAVNLYAGEDIVLKRGIQGNNKAKVFAKGNFYADFVERADVKVAKNVEANTIMNANVSAEGKVIVSGKKGFIVGGSVHGTKGIECKGLGNEAEVRTMVHAGILPDILEKSRSLIKEEKELASTMEVLLEEMKKILLMKKEKGMIPIMLEQKLIMLKNQREIIIPKLTDLKQQKEEHLLQVERAKGSVVRVDGKLYRGCLISVDSGQMLIEKGTSYMEYRNLSGMIVGSVIIKN